jgi:hypothetical protein
MQKQHQFLKKLFQDVKTRRKSKIEMPERLIIKKKPTANVLADGDVTFQELEITELGWTTMETPVKQLKSQ